MYFVDRKKIEEHLSYIEECLAVFQERTSWKTTLEKLALERLAQGVIEAMIDVGNGMIDGFIMRDPGSYEDIIDILLDENVINVNEANQLKKVIAYRKILVQSYTAIDSKRLSELMANSYEAVSLFPTQIRRYLDEELGPVSAFMPTE
jgi:uncharacterized protein YutE (UPF0331/DUF86 family)